jgi:hypothetical protein
VPLFSMVGNCNPLKNKNVLEIRRQGKQTL